MPPLQLRLTSASKQNKKNFDKKKNVKAYMKKHLVKQLCLSSFIVRDTCPFYLQGNSRNYLP